MKNIKYIFTDFDGVLTDNKVFVSSDGTETVICNRSDGIAINGLKKFGIRVIIISTETNQVVKVRGDKLEIETYFGISNKKEFLKDFIFKNKFDIEKILYVGNDINDLGAINLLKLSACPSDSHNEVKKNVSYILNTKGGDGVLREVAEKVLNINLINILGYDN